MTEKILILISLFFVFGINSTFALPNNSSTSSIKYENLIELNSVFSTGSSECSADGKYLLIHSSKEISMFESINKHYLVDIDNKTFGEIDYGITEAESYYISNPKWIPSGKKIYFSVFKRGHGPGTYGGTVVICNPDGSDLRVIGSSKKVSLSDVIGNLGGGVVHRNLQVSPDSRKISFEYEDPENFRGDLWIENIDGTKSFELHKDAGKLFWLNATKVLFRTQNGDLVLTDDRGNIIKKLSPANQNDKYGILSVSPDKQKMAVYLRLEEEKYQNYISNINGSDSILVDDDFVWGPDITNYIGDWQPNGSSMIFSDDGNLFLIKGKEDNKQLLYNGNATRAQWFPDGNKILFVDNENKMYSIDMDGANLSFITDIGLSSHYIWDRLGKKEISISPSGNIIAFTSGYTPEDELMDREPSLIESKHLAAPIFIVNSDGTNLTQLTPSKTGRYDYLEEWQSDGEMMTVSYYQFTNNGNIHGDPTLYSLNDINLTGDWKKLPVSQIINKEKIDLHESDNGSNIQDDLLFNEPASSDSINSKNKQSPSFKFIDSLLALSCICLLKWRDNYD